MAQGNTNGFYALIVMDLVYLVMEEEHQGAQVVIQNIILMLLRKNVLVKITYCKTLRESVIVIQETIWTLLHMSVKHVIPVVLLVPALQTQTVFRVSLLLFMTHQQKNVNVVQRNTW